MTAASEIKRRPVILVALGAFWPGNAASGPIQSFRNMAEALGDDFDIRLVAEDRPRGALRPSAPSGEWMDLGFAKAAYCRRAAFGAVGLADLVVKLQPDVIWMNGVFDRYFTIPLLVMRRLARLPKAAIILSPRGEFGAGALALSSGRKRAYLALARSAGLLRGVTLHATGLEEAGTIAAVLPRHPGVAVAPNITRLGALPDRQQTASTEPLRIVFLSRISRKKNLDYGLRLLADVKVPVVFDIFGPLEDRAYWHECESLIARLPANVQARHAGEVAYRDVAATLSSADLFFLPTLDENFGHSIFEALAAGTPVLISDQTPWRGLLDGKAGWDLPLDRPEAFTSAIEAFAALDPAGRENFRRGARQRAEAYVAKECDPSLTKAMLDRAIARDGAP